MNKLKATACCYGFAMTAGILWVLLAASLGLSSTAIGGGGGALTAALAAGLRGYWKKKFNV